MVYHSNLLVTGVTYRRKIVLVPLRTESVLKLTPIIRKRLRIILGALEAKVKMKLCREIRKFKRTQVLGYVPIQIVNLSLEEV